MLKFFSSYLIYLSRFKSIPIKQSILSQNKGKGKLLPKIEEIPDGKAHTNTWKLIRNISTVTDVFLNQKRVNVCENSKKMASLESF